MERQVLHCVKTYNKTLKESLYIKYSQFSNVGIVIWGTGDFGLKLFKLFIDLDLTQNVKAFCCSEVSKNQEMHELPVLSAKEAREKFPKAVFIIASSFYKEILNSGLCNGLKILVLSESSPLLSSVEILYFQKKGFCGFNVNWFHFYFSEPNFKQKILEITNLLDDEKSKLILNNRMNFMLTGDVKYLSQIPIDKVSYFSEEYLNINHNEVYVDCGAFNGDSILEFSNYVGAKYNKIIAFEPSKDIYLKLEDTVIKNSLRNVITVNAGNV